MSLSYVACHVLFYSFNKDGKLEITINVPVVYMVRYKVVLRGDYPYRGAF